MSENNAKAPIAAQSSQCTTQPGTRAGGDPGSFIQVKNVWQDRKSVV